MTEQAHRGGGGGGQVILTDHPDDHAEALCFSNRTTDLTVMDESLPLYRSADGWTTRTRDPRVQGFEDDYVGAVVDGDLVDEGVVEGFTTGHLGAFLYVHVQE